MPKTKIWLAILCAALLVPATARLHAQETGKIHGHVQDPAGTAVKRHSKLSTDGKTAKYSFTTNASGDYKGDGIAPGTYTLLYRAPTTSDQFRRI